MKKKALELSLNKEIKKIERIKTVTMDSRKLDGADVFLAIRGGNNFVKEALQKGVSLVISDDKTYENLEKVIIVQNTVEFMQKWAKKYLELLDIFVVGITGSNGKTSTKDIVYDFLSLYKNGKKTEGNYNNHIGLPFTVLNLSEKDKFVVLEMGMSGFGEIELLSDIAKPDFGIITNIGDSHLEFMKTRENISLAKSEIVSHVKNEMIINGDDPLLKNIKGVKIGFDNCNEYQIIADETNQKGTKFKIKKLDKEYEIETNLLGKHNLLNLTMAFALIDKLGYDLDKITEKSKELNLTKMRFEKIVIGEKTYINDAYNASPISMNFALDTFENLYKDRIKMVVLGDMLELGEKSRELHESFYEKLKKSDLNKIYLYGNEMRYLYNKFSGDTRVSYFGDKEAIKNELKKTKEPCAILLKGSRGMKLEEILEK